MAEIWAATVSDNRLDAVKAIRAARRLVGSDEDSLSEAVEVYNAVKNGEHVLVLKTDNPDDYAAAFELLVAGGVGCTDNPLEEVQEDAGETDDDDPSGRSERGEPSLRAAKIALALINVTETPPAALNVASLIGMHMSEKEGALDPFWREVCDFLMDTFPPVDMGEAPPQLKLALFGDE
jgi:hypothetical protein